jgi:hypothetical protein
MWDNINSETKKNRTKKEKEKMSPYSAEDLFTTIAIVICLIFITAAATTHIAAETFAVSELTATRCVELCSSHDGIDKIYRGNTCFCRNGVSKTLEEKE